MRIRHLRQDKHYMVYPGLFQTQKGFMLNMQPKMIWNWHENCRRINLFQEKQNLLYHPIHGNKIGTVKKGQIQRYFYNIITEHIKNLKEECSRKIFFFTKIIIIM